MVIADLKQDCSSCKGSGKAYGFDEYGTLRHKITPICLTCRGKGYVLTALGQEVWDLFQPLVEELLLGKKGNRD
ncbi:hypothetical protein WDW89_02750 [Deltaproteobacteria bacterium TL4]